MGKQSGGTAARRVVKALDLKPGDEIEINVAGTAPLRFRTTREAGSSGDDSPTPASSASGYKFNRAELYDREVLKSSEPVEA